MVNALAYWPITKPQTPSPPAVPATAAAPNASALTGSMIVRITNENLRWSRA